MCNHKKTQGKNWFQNSDILVFSFDLQENMKNGISEKTGNDKQLNLKENMPL